MTIQPKVTTILADFIWLCGSAVKSFYILIQCWTRMTLCCKNWGSHLGWWGKCSAWIWIQVQILALPLTTQGFVLAIDFVFSCCVWLFVNPWTVAWQAPLSMGFPRQESWNGLPFPSPGHLPNPGIRPLSFSDPALAGRFFSSRPPGKPRCVS